MARWTKGPAGFLLVVALSGVAAAWELQLREEITTPAPVVRLGDIAELQGIEPGLGEVLRQIIVAPGPTRSHRRVLTGSDVRKTLAQRGVDLQQCQIAGASRIVISYGPGENLAGHSPRVLKATRRQTSSRNGDPAESAQHLNDPAEESPSHAPIQVIVPVRAIGRGEVLRASDIALRQVENLSEPATVVQRLEDAVGREARQPLAADQPLSIRALKQPLLVRRRDEVEVWVRCGGIRARRSATALSDGSLGDMITVDAKDGLKTQFVARVVDIRQVEVLANSTSVGRRSE
ncbi:MAG: flagellar basal body P-ring formation chaperone FlgA [Pirellulaceae bacterium]